MWRVSCGARFFGVERRRRWIDEDMAQDVLRQKPTSGAVFAFKIMVKCEDQLVSN
jgi:hypothetical protein